MGSVLLSHMKASRRSAFGSFGTTQGGGDVKDRARHTYILMEGL